MPVLMKLLVAWLLGVPRAAQATFPDPSMQRWLCLIGARPILTADHLTMHWGTVCEETHERQMVSV